MNERARLDDVARLAGVSPRTVSRVVNRLPNVSRKARASVEQAISALDYRPNFAARALASSRSCFVGIVIPTSSSGYFLSFQAAIMAACRDRGLHPIFEQVPPDGADLVDQLTQTLREINLAGLILLPEALRVPGLREFVHRTSLPCVAISPYASEPDMAVIGADAHHGEVALADLFWQQGHRRFAVGRVDLEVPFVRGAAFKARLQELGATPDDVLEFSLGTDLPPLEVGRRLGEDIVGTINRPTAVFALNDEVAAGAMGYFLTVGLDIPRDIAVAGFDDSPIAQATWPPLTTVRQPIEAMARTAVKWIATPAQDGEPRARMLPVELIVRGSTETLG